MPILSYGLEDAKSSIDDHFFRSGTRVYKCYATPDLDENQIRELFPVQIFDHHVSDEFQIVSKVSVSLFSKNKGTYHNPLDDLDPLNNLDCLVWLVAVDYGPWVPFEHTDSGDPRDQPIQVFTESQTFEEICDVDVDGNPVVNGAFDPFDPPVTRDRTRPVIRVVRNEDVFNIFTIIAYADKVNTDTVDEVYEPRTLKCAAPIGVPKFSQFLNQVYYEVTYVYHYDPDTWDAQPLNQGIRELDPTDPTKRRQILDQSGQPVTSPVLLDEDGHALLPPVDSSNVNYRRHKRYHEISFADAFQFPPGTFLGTPQ